MDLQLIDLQDTDVQLLLQNTERFPVQADTPDVKLTVRPDDHQLANDQLIDQTTIDLPGHYLYLSRTCYGLKQPGRPVSRTQHPTTKPNQSQNEKNQQHRDG